VQSPQKRIRGKAKAFLAFPLAYADFSLLE
jgi:hypothetical protein